MLQRLSPLPLQRARGRASLAVEHRRGGTVISDLYQQGCAKLRMPASRGATLEAITINTSGGLTGGDRLEWSFRVGAGASLCVTSQACERAYAAAADHAEVKISIDVGSDGFLGWLPQETILFDTSALRREIDITLRSGARMMLAEGIVFGRQHMGEAVTSSRFRDRWRIRRGERLVHAEDVRLGSDAAAALASSSGLNGAHAVGTLVLFAPNAEAFIRHAREIAGPDGGVSLLDERLIVRLVCRTGFGLRQRLVALINCLSDGRPFPKAWGL